MCHRSSSLSGAILERSRGQERDSNAKSWMLSAKWWNYAIFFSLFVLIRKGTDARSLPERVVVTGQHLHRNFRRSIRHPGSSKERTTMIQGCCFAEMTRGNTMEVGFHSEIQGSRALFPSQHEGGWTLMTEWSRCVLDEYQRRSKCNCLEALAFSIWEHLQGRKDASQPRQLFKNCLID